MQVADVIIRKKEKAAWDLHSVFSKKKLHQEHNCKFIGNSIILSLQTSIYEVFIIMNSFRCNIVLTSQTVVLVESSFSLPYDIDRLLLNNA